MRWSRKVKNPGTYKFHQQLETGFFEKFQNTTRIVIAGTQCRKEAAQLFLHTIRFAGNSIEHYTSFSEKSGGEDFVLFEAQDSNLQDYHPNIVLVTGISDHQLYETFLKTIVAGGIVIYNEDDKNLTEIIENAENYFRKIPYKTPDFYKSNGKNFLNTDIGEIPVNISGENLSYTEGVKHLSQQLGIMEEAFYEALMSF